MIETIRIFPPIGIARLGNSPDGYFIGPERPLPPALPDGGYRDAAGRIKRQAARFHLFGYDAAGALVGEITAADAEIVWTVHLANTKAAAEKFHGKDEPTHGLRNGTFHDRSQLRFDPGAVQVSGRNPDFADLAGSRTTGAAKELQIDQQFLDQPVKFSLGTVTTDDRGLLLVLAGHGESKSPTGASIDAGTFADKDGWYDDVSDGRISASVELADGSTPAVADAWLLTGPPKYAPGLQTVVTLYDTLLQMAIDRGMLPDPFATPASQPSLATDILPILTRAANMRWVYSNGAPSFNPAGFHHTFNNLPPAAKAAVFARLSQPPAIAGNTSAGAGNMPKMWSDQFPGGPNGTLTKTQYKTIQKWRDGQFVPGTAPAATDPITPEGLTRAALDTCVGAPFYPGIEASWKIRDVFAYAEPFRLNSALLAPGDVSSQMSLPWQSDFIDCAAETGNAGVELVWWPAQRPMNVLRLGTSQYIPWARVSDANPSGMDAGQTVSDWASLSFVLERANGRFEEEPR